METFQNFYGRNTEQGELKETGAHKRNEVPFYLGCTSSYDELVCSMPALDHWDSLCLQAAEGWLDLGDADEAFNELQKICPGRHEEPEVMEIRCRALEVEGNFSSCLVTARTLCEQFPNRLRPLLLYAHCLQSMGRAPDAYELLLYNADRFSSEPEVPYQLALLASKLGKVQQSMIWLDAACDLGGRAFIRRALEDKNFELRESAFEDLMPLPEASDRSLH